MREEQLIYCILREGDRFLKLFIHVVMKQELISFMYFFSLLYSFLFLFYFSFFFSAPSISYFSYFLFLVSINFYCWNWIFKNKIATNERKASVTSRLQSHKRLHFCCRSCYRTLHFPITSKNWYTIFQNQVYSFIALKQAIEKLI